MAVPVAEAVVVVDLASTAASERTVWTAREEEGVVSPSSAFLHSDRPKVTAQAPRIKQTAAARLPIRMLFFIYDTFFLRFGLLLLGLSYQLNLKSKQKEMIIFRFSKTAVSLSYVCVIV